MSKNAPIMPLSHFREFLFRPVVPIDDLTDFEGQPLKIILSYWRRKQLVPFVGEGKGLRISFAQLVWLRMLDSLRQLGYSINDMAKLCAYLFERAYKDNLPKINLQRNRSELLKKQTAGTIDDNERQTLELIEQIQADEPLMLSLKHSINYLTQLITSCLDRGVEAGIYVFSSGTVAERLGDEVTTSSGEKVDIRKPHIYLSVVYFLEEFIEHEELSSLFMAQMLTDQEKLVLSEMRRKNISSLSITLQEGKMLEMNIKTTGMITNAQAEQIKKILSLNNYENIVLHTRDKHSLSFSRTKKIKTK